MSDARILIIEDEPLEAEHLRLHLRKAGYQIAGIVAAGNAAIEQAKNDQIDLMVVDIVLPGEIDGIEAVRRINETKAIPTIFITAHVNDDLLLRAEQVHPFAYLQKPYRHTELEFIVKVALTRGQLERELSQKKRLAENSLAESRNALARAQQIAHLGNWVYRVADRHIEWSDELYRIFGRDPQSLQITYDLLRSWIHPDDQKPHDTYLERLLKLKPGWNIEPLEYRLLLPNGRQRWVLVDSTVDFDIKGDPLRLVGTVLDITERKSSELERDRLNRELQQAHKMDAIGQLTGGIAHDFNNQLGIILGFLDLATTGSITPERRNQYLDQAKKAGERATKLVSQMLSFSRADKGESKPLQLYPLVKENLEMLRATLPTTINLKMELDESLPEVMMDPTQFHQLLMNLCINARDAMGGIGELSIRLTKTVIPGSECAACFKWVTGEWVELSVADNNGGVDKTILTRIFEPFFTTKDAGKGTGMGLAVVDSVMKHHKGHVLIDTREGIGTKFRLLFPPLERAVLHTPVAEKPGINLLQGNGEQLLVVDDETELGQYLGDLLELYNYRVKAFSDSQEALTEFLKNPEKYALLLTDQTMPTLSGLELIGLVRKKRPDLPVVLCTGYSEKIDHESAAKQEIHYLDKPINSELLISLLADIFSTPHNTDSPVLISKHLPSH